MRITKTLAVAGTGVALAAAVAVPASAHAGSAHPAASKVFHTTLSPKSGIKPGTHLTLKGTGAKKSTTYDCVLIVIHGTAYALDSSSIRAVESTKKGTVTCKETFEPFSGTVGGKKISCPTTKANKKAGFKCALAVSNTSKTSSGIQYFTAKK